MWRLRVGSGFHSSFSSNKEKLKILLGFLIPNLFLAAVAAVEHKSHDPVEVGWNLPGDLLFYTIYSVICHQIGPLRRKYQYGWPPYPNWLGISCLKTSSDFFHFLNNIILTSKNKEVNCSPFRIKVSIPWVRYRSILLAFNLLSQSS